jgi:hypothetical protein
LFSAKMLCLIDMQHGIGEVYWSTKASRRSPFTSFY